MLVNAYCNFYAVRTDCYRSTKLYLQYKPYQMCRRAVNRTVESRLLYSLYC